MSNQELKPGDISHVTVYSRIACDCWAVATKVDKNATPPHDCWADVVLGLSPEGVDDGTIILEIRDNLDEYTVPPHDQIPDDVWRAIGERALIYDANT